MHSTVTIPAGNMAASCMAETPPGSTAFAEYGWCGPSAEDNYNENYIPNDSIPHHHPHPHGPHPGDTVLQSYFDYQTHPLSGTNNGTHPSYGPSSDPEDCCSGSGPEYGYGSRSPTNSSYNVWECSGNPHENPSPSSVMHSPSHFQNSGNMITGTYPGRPTAKRRTTANKKERRRTQSINNAFAELRDCIPNVPADTKLSKIKTLRLATSYIAYLSDVLSGDDPSRTPAAFTAEISRKMARGDEKRRKELLMAELNNAAGGSGIHHGASTKNSHAVTGDRKSKGRTGWPQHVWALELQQ